MAAKASVLREDWATAEQIERVQLQLLDVVDFINRFRTILQSKISKKNNIVLKSYDFWMQTQVLKLGLLF
ncbi:hypothetical protein JG687_00010393 [Phytophthora cactorum]|uniref:Uncharacterized protein n=1 Tax=Phytophthora cactorum TaxID=29920 RepID=A0A8T1UB76_9STRA|nr:hypothetical protein JG687_00010393 [Phytophthora cactorum]